MGRLGGAAFPRARAPSASSGHKSRREGRTLRLRPHGLLLFSFLNTLHERPFPGTHGVANTPCGKRLPVLALKAKDMLFHFMLGNR